MSNSVKSNRSSWIRTLIFGADSVDTNIERVAAVSAAFSDACVEGAQVDVDKIERTLSDSAYVFAEVRPWLATTRTTYSMYACGM
jgi:hypothetical protein